ncbi:glycosyl hydrolase family 28 protein, partial [Ralstonia pseudosolanacearum]|uniref:glycosyl hydrolase family 28 protein n=1 Tax=Ralstonia pseudosolanacearum TaxID=1310165 RepID=UPI003D17DBCC
RNCTLRNTDNGVRVKTWRGSPPSAATNINFDDIVMENVKNPIIIDQEYCAEGGNCRGNVASKVKLSNINFRNIRGTSRSKNAIRIRCSKEFPCQNVQTFNIDLKYLDTSSPVPLPALSECAHVKVGTGGIQNPPPCMLMANT